MTEAFRTSPNSTAFNGTVMNTVTYISITWAWLGLPIASIVLTFIFLIVVIVRNNKRGIPIWKSSNLALLFHELEGWDKTELEVGGPEDVKKRAAQMNAYIMSENGTFFFSRV